MNVLRLLACISFISLLNLRQDFGSWPLGNAWCDAAAVLLPRGALLAPKGITSQNLISHSCEGSLSLVSTGNLQSCQRQLANSIESCPPHYSKHCNTSFSRSVCTNYHYSMSTISIQAYYSMRRPTRNG